jgi:hypothetical protein
LIDSAINNDDLDTNEEFKFQGCYIPPPLQKSHPEITSAQGVTKERLQHVTAEGDNPDN